MREVYLDYPAAAMSVLTDDVARVFSIDSINNPSNWSFDYLLSIADGRIALADLLADSQARCPDEKWVLAGYSQGALVISEVLAQFPDYSRYGGVMLIANPANANDPNTLQTGTAVDETSGIGSYLYTSPIPADLNGLVLSECNYRDLVCDTASVVDRIVANLDSLPRDQVVAAEVDFATDVHTAGYDPTFLKISAQTIVEQLMGMPVPIESGLTLDVEPGVEFLEQLEVKPLRSGLLATWSLREGETVPPNENGLPGVLIATDGGVVGNLPIGRYTIDLDVRGEFDDHTRQVTLTINSGTPLSAGWYDVVDSASSASQQCADVLVVGAGTDDEGPGATTDDFRSVIVNRPGCRGGSEIPRG